MLSVDETMMSERRVKNLVFKWFSRSEWPIDMIVS